jgi:3-methylcrotonyl-CoA carboxylase alpha subunit
LYAEDPERGFLPSTGVLSRLRLPETLEHVRVDAGVQEGDEVSVHYDPMIAKVIAWAPDRTAALERLRQALEQTEVEGVRTNARFLWDILGADQVRAGEVSTRLLEQALQPVVGVPEAEATDAWLIAAAVAVQRLPGDEHGRASAAGSPWQAATGFRLNSAAKIRVPLRLGEHAHWLEIRRAGRNPHPGSARPLPQAGEVSNPHPGSTPPLPFTGEVAQSAGEGDLLVKLGDKTHRVALRATSPGHVCGVLDGRPVAARVEFDHDLITVRRQCLRFDFREDTGAEHHASAEHEGHFRAPMPGTVLDVRVSEGQEVTGGAVLVVLEAMKMEHSLFAPWDGRVKTVSVKAGDRVEEGADLVLLEPRPEA